MRERPPSKPLIYVRINPLNSGLALEDLPKGSGPYFFGLHSRAGSVKDAPPPRALWV